ncbi:hypothetical protein [Sphingorhabdus sp. Alg239-R122]|uniref:hypothetical protein n=1 Tax=Sphingorhabdus sp. Alg239-R122 TaxID=2305989 RepID=UPI0013D9B6EB|nr:hypothetical protein [Sphingorhabdus sp. Alg239-R122]
MTLISLKTASRLLDCTGFMNWHYGVTFNTILTINFEQLGMTSDAEIAKIRNKLNTALQQQIINGGRKYGDEQQHHYIYAMECSRDHGLHMHKVLAVPGYFAIRIKDWLQKWARRNFGEDVNPKAVHVRCNCVQNFTDRIFIQSKLVRYILKTTEDVTLLDQHGYPKSVKHMIGLKRGCTSQSFSTNRIAGSSQSISYGEQIRWCYQPVKQWEDVLNGWKLDDYRSRVSAQKFCKSIEGIEI